VQGPNASGRSRQGAPECNTATASNLSLDAEFYDSQDVGIAAAWFLEAAVAATSLGAATTKELARGK
jgi:hypothetical protein